MNVGQNVCGRIVVAKQMSEKPINFLLAAWRVVNAALALVFAGLIVDAWVEIFYFKNAEKYYYYIATLFIIPLITCLIVVFGWDLDKR